MTNQTGPVPHTAPRSPAPSGQQPAPVDLAHELREARKLQVATLVMAMLALFFSIVAAVSSAYVAITLYKFIQAMRDALG